MSPADDKSARSARSGPWAIVLGASRGLGLASARALAKSGYRLCLVYREPRAQLGPVTAAIEELEAISEDVLHFNVDALTDAGRAVVLETMQSQLGGQARVAVLVHSLAKGALKPLSAQPKPEKQWASAGGDDPTLVQAWKASLPPPIDASSLTPRDLQLTLQAMGTSLLDWVYDLRHRHLLASDTRILALTSEGVRRAWPGYAAVAAAKAVLESLVRSMALELGPFGIRANCIQAGVTDTQALRRIPHSTHLKLHAVARNPMGRLTTPDDVGAVVALLCRPEAAWINGTVVIADGGEHLC